jgi:hypothetical protein
LLQLIRRNRKGAGQGDSQCLFEVFVHLGG